MRPWLAQEVTRRLLLHLRLKDTPTHRVLRSLTTSLTLRMPGKHHRLRPRVATGETGSSWRP